jgi:hypothetical protein
MSDCMISQDPQDRPSGERDGLDAPARAALARSASEVAADSMRATLRRWDRAKGRGGHPTALERYAMSLVLTERAELIAQRAALEAKLVESQARENRLMEAADRIMAATPGNTNSATAKEAFTWCAVVAGCALDDISSTLTSIQAGGAS